MSGTRPHWKGWIASFVSDDWLDIFPDHSLSALSTECSDHAPLLLKTDCAIPHFKRFRFENIWPRFDGFLETVATAWNAPVPAHELDAFRVLDIKLRATATALKSWSAKHVGNVRLQLAIAKEIVFRFDCAQENRTLAPHEVALRHKAKLNCLGLASLQRSIIRQRSRITYLTEGDAKTKFFHLQACHMSRKNYIESVRVGDAHLVREEEKAEAFFKHFDDILGSRCSREANLDFTFLGLPVIDTSLLDVCFSFGGGLADNPGNTGRPCAGAGRLHWLVLPHSMEHYQAGHHARVPCSLGS